MLKLFYKLGIKEKVIAAHRSGIKKILLPLENKKDLFDVPDDVPPGPAYMRVRLTSDRSAYPVMAPDGEPPPSGPAADGEVEDYQVNLYQSAPTT